MKTLKIVLLRIGLPLLGLFLFDSRALGQSIRRIPVHVTAVSAAGIYIDQGRDSMIQAGDTLLLRPMLGAVISTTIVGVSKSNARALSMGTTVAIIPGVGGDVEVPESRFIENHESSDQETGEFEQHSIPDHPPWQTSIGEKAQAVPLLAPAHSTPKEERAVEIHGRTYFNSLHTWGSGQSANRYLYSRLGTALDVRNPFQKGGSFQLRGDAVRRNSYLANQEDQESTRLRLDRFSYRFGEELGSSLHGEFGRFLQPLFPELGVLDGASIDTPTGRHQRSGISLGAVPDPFRTGFSTEATQLALFHRYSGENERDLQLGIGYQKTLYGSHSDRDVLLTTWDMRPTKQTYVHSTLWIDYYGSGDHIKSNGLELTEVQLNGSYYFEGNHGINISYSHVRWPELKRNEFITLDPDRIRNDSVQRLGARAWYGYSDALRFDGRVDFWGDQDDSGANGDVGFRVRDMFWNAGWAELHVFHNEGNLVSGNGMRIAANRSFGALNTDLHYELASYDNSSASSTMQHRLWTNISGQVGKSTELSLSLDYHTGSGTNALSVGLFLQFRF